MCVEEGLEDDAGRLGFGDRDVDNRHADSAVRAATGSAPHLPFVFF
jgi:hypothetical protein